MASVNAGNIRKSTLLLGTEAMLLFPPSLLLFSFLLSQEMESQDPKHMEDSQNSWSQGM